MKIAKQCVSEYMVFLSVWCGPRWNKTDHSVRKKFL